jgi:TM2 domain-containing membrane protein YozV
MSAPNSVTGALSQVAIQALPPDIQNLLNQKGKTSDRIKAAINWASRPDPRVLARHRKLDPRIQRVEDIRSASLAQKDAVARSIARDYRRRAAMTGAVTGLPGGAWAIVAAGADVQLTAIYAVRMAASVAQAYGYNTTDLNEQAELADVLAVAAGVDTLRGVGQYLSRQGLVHLLPEVLPKILMRLSVQLTEEQAAKWIGRLIPGVGALVGGAIDYGFLRVAGDRAVAHYHNRLLGEVGALPAGAAQAALPPPVSAAAPAEQRVVEGSLAPSAPELPAQTAPVPADMAPPPVAAYQAADQQMVPSGQTIHVRGADPIEIKPKSGFFAAFLELVIPGAGAIYTGHGVVGIIWFLLTTLVTYIGVSQAFGQLQQGYNDVVNTQTLDTSTLPNWFWYFAAGGVLWLLVRMFIVVRYAANYRTTMLSRPPEHFAWRLITFALLSLLVTIVACAALTYAALSGLAQYITPR